MWDYDFQKSTFYRAMMTGLFVGYFVTLCCLAFDIFYRDTTGFSPSNIINVSSLIFSINLLFWFLGMVYYVFLRTFKKADLIFILSFLLMTSYFIWKSTSVQRSADHEINVQFRGLLMGIIIILGIGTLVIPYLFHSKKFEERVL